MLMLRSSSSHIRDFISEDEKDRRFDFLAYSRSLRDSKILQHLKEPIKVVGKNILPKDSSVEQYNQEDTIEKKEEEVENDKTAQEEAFPWQVSSIRGVTFLPSPPNSPQKATPTIRKKGCKPLTISTLRLVFQGQLYGHSKINPDDFSTLLSIESTVWFNSQVGPNVHDRYG